MRQWREEKTKHPDAAPSGKNAPAASYSMPSAKFPHAQSGAA
jgi:hypothetical protein